MKRRLMVLAAALLYATAGVFAQSENDFNVTLTTDGTGVVITGYTGTATAVRIPAQIQGMPVKEIGNGAFERNSRKTMTSITSVVIPAGVVAIGTRAFFYQPSLVSVTIPPTVTTIGDYAFSDDEGNTPKITEITLPASLTRAGKRIFYNCTNLKTVTIPEGVRVIGEEMFRGTAITSIKIPDTVTSIGSGAFEACRQLASVTLPAGITDIKYNTFAQCTALTAIVIPEGVTEIGRSAFSYWSGIRGFPMNLASVTLPITIKVIGNSAFEGCSTLTTVIIPESVESITFNRGEAAFAKCSKLNLASQAALKKVGYTGSFQ